jgi:hypothetical protein
MESSCCSSKSFNATKQEPISTNGTSVHTSPSNTPQMLAQSSLPFDPALYQSYLNNDPTVFTYPPTYGSFQNPLQPSAWRESTRNNDYAQPPGPNPIAAARSMPYHPPVLPGPADTIHSCGCGDTCQCVGCAAHPYNNATQDYVRSAWASMSGERFGEVYTNGHPPPTPSTNGHSGENGVIPPQNGEPGSSPTAHTPSSTTSGNGEEQSLSASDFFFVSYPFSADGCGGDTMSCPCGDDCECLGCTIHRQPGIPDMACGGEKDACPCGDDCECIGCTIHQNAPIT